MAAGVLCQQIGLKSGAHAFNVIKRSFMTRMLTAVINRPDTERIRKFGPQIVCAEWLLRCGAECRWKNAASWETDYNHLVQNIGARKQRVLEEINAEEATIMDVGFPHFENCKDIKKIRLHNCVFVDDECLPYLRQLNDSLQHLEISSCPGITEKGLSQLVFLSMLKTLLLYDLPGVNKKKDVYEQLTKGLPNCNVVFKDVEKEAKSKD